jgi:hypothetical protein
MLSHLLGWCAPSLPLSVPKNRSSNATDPTSRFPHRRPCHGLKNHSESSPRLWLPFRVSPVRHRETVRDPEESRCDAPSEVSSPSASVNHEEPPNPGESHPAGYVAPTGFLALSTLCSPRGLPGLFHPGTAHGVLPFEASILVRCRTPSRTPRPSGFRLNPNQKRPPTRDSHTKRSPATGLGISQVAVPHAPLGFPAPRFLAPASKERPKRPFIPSRAFSDRSHADLTAGAPGFRLTKTRLFSLETNQPPCSSSPRYPSRRFGNPVGLGHCFPSEARPRRREARPHLHPTVRSPAGACREAYIR